MKKNALPLFLTLVSCVILGGVFYLSYQSRITRSQYDPVTGCLKTGPTQKVTILIDVTSQLTELQKLAVETRIQSLRKNVPVNTLITIITVDDQIATKKPLFQMCSIRDGDDADALTENEAILKRKWMTEFQTPLELALNQALTLSPSNSTPLFQSIQVSNLLTRFDDQVRPSSLHIFSDLLHHDEQISFYQNPPSYTAFSKAYNYSYYGTDLTNHSITIHYIADKSAQEKKLIVFWEEYFKKMGAKSVEYIRLEGIR
jgi:hypothetical protein